jgi:hypothetical protein
MARYTVDLDDEQELALKWMMSLEGLTADDVLARWIGGQAAEAARDFATRLGALKGISITTQEDVRRRLLGVPDPEIVARDEQIAALQVEVAALKSKGEASVADAAGSPVVK